MRSLDFVGTRRWFFAFSGALAVAALVLLAIPPTLRPGIEFTAGTTTLVRFERPVAQSALRDAYAGLDHPEARIQSTGEREYLIRTSELRVPDSALIEVNPAATAGSAPPPAELGALRLGAAGEGGEVPLRVFRFGEACDFGEEIARFPAGTEAVVYAEIRDCPTPRTPRTPRTARTPRPARTTRTPRTTRLAKPTCPQSSPTACRSAVRTVRRASSRPPTRTASAPPARTPRTAKTPQGRTGAAPGPRPTSASGA